MEKIMGIIYCYTNQTTGKKYIGQTINERHRKACHKHFALKKNSQYYFHRSIRKHGWEAFNYEVLEECDESIMNERETFYIKEFNTHWPNGYNETTDGSTPSQEARKKIGAANKKRIAEMSEEKKAEWKRKQSESMKGHKQTEYQKNRVMEENQMTYLLITPENKYIKTTNLSKFCKTIPDLINSQGNLTKIAQKIPRYNSCKGWKAEYWNEEKHSKLQYSTWIPPLIV